MLCTLLHEVTDDRRFPQVALGSFSSSEGCKTDVGLCSGLLLMVNGCLLGCGMWGACAGYGEFMAVLSTPEHSARPSIPPWVCVQCLMCFNTHRSALLLLVGCAAV